MTGPFLPHVPLTTKRLVLRQPSFDDVPRLARLAGDRDVARMLLAVPHPYTEAHASAFIGDVLASNLTGDSLALAVARAKESHALIGLVSFSRRGDTAAIGWWFGKPFWGKGFATEAVRAVLSLAFRDPAIQRLEAGAFVDNPASLRVQEKLGFRRTGEGMKASLARGADVPHVDMSLTREAFEAAASH